MLKGELRDVELHHVHEAVIEQGPFEGFHSEDGVPLHQAQIQQIYSARYIESRQPDCGFAAAASDPIAIGTRRAGLYFHRPASGHVDTF